jgi:hypothetical protein
MRRDVRTVIVRVNARPDLPLLADINIEDAIRGGEDQ